MTTPASIPEPKPGPSDFNNRTHFTSRITSYEKARPRSHVSVSRRSTRAKYSRKISRGSSSLKAPSIRSVLSNNISQNNNAPGPDNQELDTPKPRHDKHQQPGDTVSGLSNHCSPIGGLPGDVSPPTPEVLTSIRPVQRRRTCSASSHPQSSVVNNPLVEAITRNVVQQLQMSTLRDSTRSARQDLEDSEDQLLTSVRDPSRTSSQQKALDRFTRELERYAEHTGAKGKLPLLTPTSANSDGTLRTISALLPFRPEFKATGLAVTSKDQAKTHAHHTKATATRETRSPFPKPSFKKTTFSQLDGNDRLPINNTERSLPTPNKMNDWKHAVINEAVPCRSQLPSTSKPATTKCLPCVPNLHLLPKSQSRCSQQDSGINTPYIATGPTAKVPRLAPSSSAPHWSELAPPHISCPQPQYPKVHVKSKDVADRAHHVDCVRETPTSPFFAEPSQHQGVTGFRRRSMVLPWQEPKTASPLGRRPIHQSNIHSNKVRPGKTGVPVKLRAPRSSIRQQSEQHSIKRRQSAPMHRDVRGPHDLDTCNKPLPDPPAPSEETDMEHDAEWVDEIPLELPMKHGNTEQVVPLQRGSRQDKHKSSITSKYIPLCARGYLINGQARPKIPQRMSSVRPIIQSTNQQGSGDQIFDRDVLRGLHIAASAACNEQVDAYIRTQTGLHIRWFLANLTPLEDLRVEPSKVANIDRTQKRAQMKRAKQRIRRSRQMKKPTVEAVQ